MHTSEMSSQKVITLAWLGHIMTVSVKKVYSCQTVLSMTHNKFDIIKTEIKQEIKDKNYCGNTSKQRPVLYFEGKLYAVFCFFFLVLV